MCCERYYFDINNFDIKYFDEIDETMVFKAANMTRGAGGPSQLHAEQHRRLLTSNKYKKENKELRVQLATLARLLATEYLDPNTLEAFVACRLIPLDKNPGVRPIGISEVTGELWENVLVGYCVRTFNRLLDHSKQLLANREAQKLLSIP